MIDRLALNSAGLGPKSPCVPGRSRAGSPGNLPGHAPAERPGDGPVPGRPPDHDRSRVGGFRPAGAWAGAIAETLAWGSDRTDRFQTPARWRGESFATIRGDRRR